MGATSGADPDAYQPGGVQQDEMREILAGQSGRREKFRRYNSDPFGRDEVFRLLGPEFEDIAQERHERGGEKDHPVPLPGLEGLHGPRTSQRYHKIHQKDERGLFDRKGLHIGAL